MTARTGTVTGHQELMEEVRDFLTGMPAITTPVFGGTGNGQLLFLEGNSTSVTENWTITATTIGPGATFTVVGSVSGAQANATSNTWYDNGLLRFFITDGATPFAISDNWTFSTTQGEMSAAGWAWQEVLFVAPIGTPKSLVSSASSSAGWSIAGILRGNYESFAHYGVSGNTNLEVVRIDCVVPVAIKNVFVRGEVTGTNQAQNLKNWRVQWSDDGSAWNDAVVRTNDTFAAGEIKNVSTGLTVTDEHLYWRVFMDLNNGNGSASLLSAVVFFDFNDNPVGRDNWGELRLKALGNGGTDEIYTAIRSFYSTGNDVYNWHLQGWIGPNDIVSAPTWTSGNGPNTRPPSQLLWNLSTPFWFQADGRHFVMTAKISTIYTSMYLGFLKTYSTPAEYPYPLCVGGSFAYLNGNQASNAQRWSLTDNDHRSFWTPGANQSSSPGTLTYVLPDGATWTDAHIWYSTNSYQTSTTVSTTMPYRLAQTLNTVPSGEYLVTPIQLIKLGTGWMGELADCYHVSGQSNAPENTFTISTDNYTVFNNIYRTSVMEFFAMRQVT